MSDPAFETRIARVLGGYADDAVVPIDASLIALAARPEHNGLVARIVRTARTTRPSAELRLLFIAAALLAALVIGTVLIGGSQRTKPGLVEVGPTPSTAVEESGLAASLLGTWVADKPGTSRWAVPPDLARCHSSSTPAVPRRTSRPRAGRTSNSGRR